METVPRCPTFGVHFRAGRCEHSDCRRIEVHDGSIAVSIGAIEPAPFDQNCGGYNSAAILKENGGAGIGEQNLPTAILSLIYTELVAKIFPLNIPNAHSFGFMRRHRENPHRFRSCIQGMVIHLAEGFDIMAPRVNLEMP